MNPPRRKDKPTRRVKTLKNSRMDLKPTWTTRKVRRETDPQNVQTKHQNAITEPNSAFKTWLQITPPQEQKPPISESIFLS